MVLNASPLYASKIIKAGALLPDTKTLFAHWDGSLSVAENLAHLRQDNVFGKASRSRIEDILRIFSQRYLRDPAVIEALTTLVSKRVPSETLDPILYFHSAKADNLLRDAVTEILAPIQGRGDTEVTVDDFIRVLTKWVEEGKTAGEWSGPTIVRIAQGLLSALRDFGILEGASKKRISPMYLPVNAFCHIAFCLHQEQPSGMRLLVHPDWNLFFLSREAVERFFIEAHQHRLLEYHAVGRVIRITFPASSLQEYAHAIAE